jgi:hypothetical protein
MSAQTLLIMQASGEEMKETLKRNFGSKSTLRQKDDFYQTPEIATLSLLSAYRLSDEVWEPACGKGSISEVLIRHKISVVATDLKDYSYGESGVDFLMCQEPLADDIVTNPPFSLALDFCRHAVDLQKDTGNRVFMLLRLDFLSSAKRKDFLTSSPLKEVLVFSKRVRFMTPNHDKPRGGVN